MSGSADSVSVYAEIRRTGRGAALQINHSHAELEFDFVVSGRGTYFLEYGHYDLSPGTLVWLLPNQQHRLMRSPDLDMWVVTVSADLYTQELLDAVTCSPVRVLSSDDALSLDKLLAHISQDADSHDLYRAGLAYAVRAARHASQTSAGPAQKKLHPAVLRALGLLRINEAPPTAAALAKACGVSADYLGQLLVDQTGRGLVEWRNRIRLERFHILYPQSGDLLTAALAAGFGSYTQFHRVFFDLIGHTPGEWAKSDTTTRTLALPSVTNTLPELEAGSARMVWYALSELALLDGGRWFSTTFVDIVLTEADTFAEFPPVPSGVSSITQLSRFQSDFLTHVESTQPALAGKLAQALRNNDVLASYAGTLGKYGFGLSDLGSLIAIYLAMAWIGTHSAPAPSVAQLQRLANRVRQALTKGSGLAEADDEQRQRAAAAFIIQSICLRHALVAAQAAGNDKIMTRLRENARLIALRTVGIDLRQTRLVF